MTEWFSVKKGAVVSEKLQVYLNTPGAKGLLSPGDLGYGPISGP